MNLPVIPCQPTGKLTHMSSTAALKVDADPSVTVQSVFPAALLSTPGAGFAELGSDPVAAPVVRRVPDPKP